MTSPPSNEERNRLRLQAWEQRNQEASRAREQTALNVHLFGQPYKTIKGDELSNRIQRMLGSYEDNTSAEPFSVPSSLAFPLSNLVHAKSEPPQSLKGPCANPPSTHASPKHHCEAESQSSNQSSQPIRSTLQKTSPNDLNERQFSTLDRLQSYTTNHVNIQVSSKDPSSPLNRTIGMLHSQAFHPPLPYKQPNAAMTQKPTAYVRPMDGLDQVASESPELKPSPEHNTSLPDVALDKSAQGKGDLLPQFLETKTTVVQYVEDILKEMTCSWPPLLSGIHSPRPDVKPKPQCSVKEIDPPKQDNNQASSTDHSHPHHSSLVLSLSSAVDSVCPSDTESMKFETEMELENGTDDPPMSSALKSEPAHVSVASGDWQLEKFIKLKQRDYRSKSQWGIAQSPKLKDGLQQPTVSVLSPARDTSNPLSLDQKTVNFTTSQKSCPSAQESAEASDAVKPNQTKNDRNGGVTVHFEWTSSTQEEESRVKDGKMEKNCHKQSRKRSVVFENESTKSHHKDKDKVWPEVSMAQHDQCTSSVKSTFYSDHASPPRSRSKPKTEARRKKDSKLPQKDKRINGYSLDGSKDTLSLVVKIDLNLLSKIPRTSRSLENDTAQKDNKPHKEVSKSRKNDKEDESCPKKKQKLQEHNPLLHTAGHENSAPSDATEKRGKKKDQNLNFRHTSLKRTSRTLSMHRS
ncbi:hypothetical protein NQD34_017353 [Periophthalmus magnuspinnatus]|nr:hypothetical protein NQD34_017353 [Periophthalmus magnuspinnatus]